MRVKLGLTYTLCFFVLIFAGSAFGDTTLKGFFKKKDGAAYKNTTVKIEVEDVNKTKITNFVTSTSTGAFYHKFMFPWPVINGMSDRSMTVYFTLTGQTPRTISGLIGETIHDIDVTLPGPP